MLSTQTTAHRADKSVDGPACHHFLPIGSDFSLKGRQRCRPFQLAIFIIIKIFTVAGSSVFSPLSKRLLLYSGFSLFSCSSAILLLLVYYSFCICHSFTTVFVYLCSYSIALECLPYRPPYGRGHCRTAPLCFSPPRALPHFVSSSSVSIATPSAVITARRMATA